MITTPTKREGYAKVYVFFGMIVCPNNDSSVQISADLADLEGERFYDISEVVLSEPRYSYDSIPIASTLTVHVVHLCGLDEYKVEDASMLVKPEGSKLFDIVALIGIFLNQPPSLNEFQSWSCSGLRVQFNH